MKRIIAKITLREFWEKHTDSEQYLKTSCYNLLKLAQTQSSLIIYFYAVSKNIGRK